MINVTIYSIHGSYGKWIVTWIVTIEHGPVEMVDLPSYITW